MNITQKKCFHQLYSKPILFAGLLILLAGIYSYTQMQTNLFPEVLFPRITVIADAGQQPVDRMMITVTKPLESAVKKVQGVTVVKSSTSRGSCVVEVYFNWGLDIYALKTQLENRINEIKGFLPVGTVISTEAMNQSLFPVYGYTLESKTHSRIALRDAGNLIARPVFSQVKGISNVVVRGGKAKEFVVLPDPAKMSSLGITPSQIKSAFEQTNFVQGNGNIADYNRLYLTLTDTRINDLQELENTIIRNDGTRIVRLKDVAHVEIQEQQEFLKINADGNDAVLIDLVKQPGVNLIDFATDVEAKADEIRGLLPAGYELKPYYNQSAFVGDNIHSVMKTIYEGLFLAIVVMVLFLRSWRASLVVMLTIPVTLAFSILLAYQALIQLKKDRKKTTPEVISDLRHSLSQAVPVVTIDFGQRISDLLGDLMSTPKPIEIKIFGNDYTTLQQIAAQAESVMKTIPGIVDIDNGLIPAGASLVFIPNQERLSQFGISLTDFQEQLSAYIGGVPLCLSSDMIEPNPAQAAMTGGLQIGSIQDGEQMRRILLRFTDFADNSPEILEKQLIFLPDGSTRPLSFFCRVEVIPGEIEERREDLKSNKSRIRISQTK